MVMAVRSASLLLLLVVSLAGAIRNLKEGPMIDAEGREYKSAVSKLNGGSTVRVRCTETSMIIMVMADLFKNGHLVSPEELFLGDVEHWQSSQCQADPDAAGDTEYVFEVGLQDCGSKLTISKDFVTYSNNLIILPAVYHHGIMRTAHSVVPVSCHYKRMSVVSSNVQQPPLVLFNTAKSPAEQSAFSLKLMTDDWTRESVSSVFYLGDLLHLEASYAGPNSGQRQLFIDSCVATLSPDATSVPRYYFIENHGCLTDAQDGSKSLFHPRTKADSLQLQLDAFLFNRDSRNSIFLTCQLKATTEMWKSSPSNKACNYERSRWKNVDGSDYVCRCCDGTCSKEANLRRLMSEDILACGTVTLGPLTIYPNK